MSTSLAIAGITLVLLGTAWTVVATFRAPELLTYPDFQNGHQHVIRVAHKARRTGWENFPPEVRDAKLKEADDQLEADLDRLARTTAAQQDRHRSGVMRWSVVGLVLIGLGSALQGAALLVA